MNVHRRDRAKLRQSPPRDGQFHVLNLNLNPNPSFSSPFSCTMPPLISPPSSALPSPSFSSPCEIRKWAIDGELLDPLSPKASDLSKIRTRKSLLDAKEYDGFAQQGGCNFLKKAEFMKLDLGIGLLSDSKEDLDLELRLGYS
ncbi:hypothetical protein Tsubulata_031651 [Turnera subulata]|uniref:Uncharacterized protein n=1 Tax=Turnera subulata TaxID=218843 RepID=A0A9Q0G8L2_9ROSI|nr:hypothetical protein Tsubulata_031651 [Turnera subulata]